MVVGKHATCQGHVSDLNSKQAPHLTPLFIKTRVLFLIKLWCMREQVETPPTNPLKDLMSQKYLYIKHFQAARDPQELLE